MLKKFSLIGKNCVTTSNSWVYWQIIGANYNFARSRVTGTNNGNGCRVVTRALGCFNVIKQAEIEKVQNVYNITAIRKPLFSFQGHFICWISRKDLSYQFQIIQATFFRMQLVLNLCVPWWVVITHIMLGDFLSENWRMWLLIFIVMPDRRIVGKRLLWTNDSSWETTLFGKDSLFLALPRHSEITMLFGCLAELLNQASNLIPDNKFVYIWSNFSMIDPL